MYGITNQNIWVLQIKCMIITNEMYGHYKSNYIQFLTLGRSHDRLYKPSKFPFLASHMTCLPKQPTSLHFLLLVSHMACLYKPLSFPFLVGYITCLSKHLIPPTNFLFWEFFRKHLLKMFSQPSKFPFLEIPSETNSHHCLHKPSKFPFLVFPYMASHMTITTYLVPIPSVPA